MDFDTLLASGVQERRTGVMSRRMPPQTTRARESVRFNDDLAESFANELIMGNSTSIVKEQLAMEGQDIDYAKIIEQKSKKFLIGPKEFDFDPHEQIFFLREA